MSEISRQTVWGINLSDPDCFRSLYDGYCDGVQYFYAPNPVPNSVDMATWPFDQNFYLKLNLAIGGSWGGTPAADFNEATYEIDWVRVWQK
ncbi:MAG: hypothetical protein J5748_06350 [Bacteroidales bacterium]|nr:hypothetical protein [Bacteroidales bacterium]